MRIKIGNYWYEPTKGAPIMIELTESDKTNIANMLPEATKYAQFTEDTDLDTAEARYAWMDA